jgi:hypothetical protein
MEAMSDRSCSHTRQSHRHGKAAQAVNVIAVRRWLGERDRASRFIERFEDFLRPPPRLESLLPAAEGGPVVILNVSRWRCDALVVKKSGVEVVELPDLTQDDVVAQAQAYLDAVGARQGETERGALGRDADVTVSADAVEAALDRCLRWMWDGFVATVLDHLGYTTTPTDD